MRRILIDRLFQSFTELERAIVSAHTILSRKTPENKELIDRIEAYENILVKQRSLATALCGHACLENWLEVARHIKLINGLSEMIRDDARDILGLTEPQEKQEATVQQPLVC